MIAKRLGRTPSQLALAWLLSRPWGVILIPATTRLEHFEENLKALDIVLTPSDLEEISGAIPPGAVHGARHPAEHMKTINQGGGGNE